MDTTKTTNCFDTNKLSDDILSFTDDKFYDFVKEVLGKTAADLLKIQAINNVPSFLLNNDLCGVIELDIVSEELDDLRQKISFSSEDGTCHVKTGITNDFKYLKKLLSSKLGEENRKKKRNTKQTTTKTTTTDSSSSSLRTTINSSSPLLTTTINLALPPLTTTTNSSSPPLTTTIKSKLPQSTTTNNSSSSHLTTKNDHIEFISGLIKRWSESNKENLYFGQLELNPDVDYTINITDNNNIFDGIVKCKCGVRIKLRKRNSKFQITNFYKHLRSSTCSMMREREKQHYQQKQLLDNIDSNDNTSDNTNDNRTTTSSSITPQLLLSDTTINAPTSQSHRPNIISLSTTRGTKRNLSSVKVISSPQSLTTSSQQSSATSSQQSSAKRHKN